MAMDVIDELQLSSQKSSQEILKKKKEMIHQLDAQILEGTDPDSIEDLILEIEEMQDVIFEKINQIDAFLRLRSKAPPVAMPPSHTTSSPSTSSQSTTSQGGTESTTVQPQSHVTNSVAAITESTAVTIPSLPQPCNTSSTNPYPQASSRLPKLTLPIFSGDPLSCQTFWDSFSAAVDTSTTLGTIQKLSYLRVQLQGDAARTIAGLPLTNTNYTHSVSLLKERFGQPNKIQNAHMQALLELPSPTNELSSLRLFYDSVETHIRGLLSLRVSKESYGALLLPIILAKLSVPTRKNLAREHSNLDWSIDDLQAAILKEIRVMETGFYTSDAQSSTAKGSYSTASFYAGIKGSRINPPSNGKKKPLCVYCKGDHSPSVCDVVNDVQKRLEIVKRGNLCFNCLGNHKVSLCNSKFRCRNCKHKHHTSLCKPISEDPKQHDKRDSEVKGAISSPQGNTPTQTSMTMAPVSHSSLSKKCPPTTNTISLLKTAIAPISVEGL